MVRKLKIKNITMKKLLLILSVSLSLFLTSSYITVNNNNNNEMAKMDSVLTESNVYSTLLMLNIKYPEVVMSQIMLESNNLRSRLCLVNNNLLGMTVPSKRKTTAMNKKGYAKYKNWMESIVDYKLYQDAILATHKLDSKKKYIAFLNKNYAKSKDYKKTITAMAKNYELRNTYYFGSI